MNFAIILRAGRASVFLGLLCIVFTPARSANELSVKHDGIGGVVTSTKGPEAGVWVIAQTNDLPTRYTKIVVTDDQGRYLLPQLPQADYKVWVRGYGLVDSEPVSARPGKQVELRAVVAPDAKAAAQYYPANYWFSLLHMPDASEFPGTGPKGNGIPPSWKTQQQFMGQTKFCLQCHQLGGKATRRIAINTPEAWNARVRMERPPGDLAMGDQAKGYTLLMNNSFTSLGRERAAKMFADWTQRIANGEVPAEAPPRPAGIERNIVVTLWGWGNGSFMHDEVASDRRDPTINANGPIYGVQTNIGKLGILDPQTHEHTTVDIPTGMKGFSHTVMMDQKGRVWMPDGGSIFQPTVPKEPRAEFCTNGAVSKFAEYEPLDGVAAFAHVYDPSTKKVTAIPSCFGDGALHVWFGNDANNTLYFASEGIGWLDTKVWDETHDPVKAQGWCPLVLDTDNKNAHAKVIYKSGDVAIDPDRRKWNLPGGTADPTKDTRLLGGVYGLGVNPVDDSVWGGVQRYPGGIVRVDRGSNPPLTCKTEYYEPPKVGQNAYGAFASHDLNLDSKGIAWVSFTSGQIGRFDRTKCKTLRGPTATGQHCPEGWKIYDAPGPHFGGQKIPAANADYLYQTFVDRFNTFGLGKDTPMFAASNSDSILAFLPSTEKWVRLRVPYPLGFHSRWLDGRIDDAAGGWKGRGAWATFSSVTTWHQEEEELANPELVKFQLRPNPLAD